MEDVNSFGEGPDNDESKSPSSPVNISVGIVGSGANIAGGNITNITNVHEPSQSFSFQNLRQGPTAQETQLRGEKLQACVKEVVCSTSFVDNILVPLQIIDYENAGGEPFGNSVEQTLELTEPLIDCSVETYNGENLFREARKRNQNFIGIIGEPGVGKTVFIKSLLQHQAPVSKSAGNNTVLGALCKLLRSFFSSDPKPFLFYVPFKRMDFTRKTSVFHFLVTPLISDWVFNDEQDKALLGLLTELPNVYIATDGLDEGRDELFSASVKFMNLYDHETPDVIVKNLFAGHILPNAVKLVTSRPDAFINLHRDCKPKFIVRILGICGFAQEQLCKHICRTAENFENVKRKLDANPDLSTLFYIPLYCKITTRHLMRMTSIDPSQKVTSTFIFTQAFGSYVRTHKYLRDNRNNLQALTKLAFAGVMNDQFIFTFNDLPSLEQKVLANFIQPTASVYRDIDEELLHGDKQFFFVHLLWQEFFAAVHLLFFATSTEFETVFGSLLESRWKAVVKFAFGLQNPSVNEEIMRLLPAACQLDNLPKKLQVCRSLISCPLKQQTYVERCLWAFEANDRILAGEAFQVLPEQLKFFNDEAAIKSIALAFVLSSKPPQCNRQVFMERNFDLCKFPLSIFMRLLDSANAGNVELKTIAADQSEIGEKEAEAIIKQINNVVKMSFIESSYTRKGFREICSAIENRRDKIECIHFIKCKIPIEEELALASCLKNVKVLWLFQCEGWDACPPLIIHTDCNPLKTEQETSSSLQQSSSANGESSHALPEASTGLPEGPPEPPSSLKQVPNLLDEYQVYFLSGKFCEAKTIIQSLCSVVIQSFKPSSHYQFRIMADAEPSSVEGWIKTIALCIAAASLAAQDEEKSLLHGLEKCMDRIWEANEMTVKEKVGLKTTLLCHVIPMMADIAEDMYNVTVEPDYDTAKIMHEVEALRYLAASQVLADHFEGAKVTLEACINTLISTFGEEAKKRQIMGFVLEDAGDLYKDLSLLDEAKDAYKLAIDVYKAATDVISEGISGRISFIKICEDKLRKVQMGWQTPRKPPRFLRVSYQ